MTRESLENLVTEATGRSDKLTLIRSALSLAIAEVSSQRLWSDLMVRDEVTIAAGALSVDLASDVARVFEITVVDGLSSRPLFCRSKKWLVERVPAPESNSTGTPTYGYLEGQTLYVLPRPTDTTVLRYSYYRLHPELDSPTSTLLIRHATAAVAAYATFWVFQSIEKMKEAEQWYATYLKQIESAKKVDSDNSVTKFEMTPRGRTGSDQNVWSNYWLDPFVKTMP